MGSTSQRILEIMEQCETFEEAFRRLDNMELAHDEQLLSEMWASMHADYGHPR